MLINGRRRVVTLCKIRRGTKRFAQDLIENTFFKNCSYNEDSEKQHTRLQAERQDEEMEATWIS